MIKQIAVLGSTGSIGQNALRVIDALGTDYSVFALSANTNIDLLAKQAYKFEPKYIAISDASYEKKLRELVTNLDSKVLSGVDCLTAIAENEQVDIVLNAVVGAAGLKPALIAAQCGKRLAIANKEALVIAGQLLTKTAKQNSCTILPVDSEHSAVFQAIQSGKPQQVKKIILTGSGGPFRGATIDDLQAVSPEQALAHPIWSMGPKITIDSATMMNKALEIIEARWLFNIPIEQVEVLIHPESIIHSLVEFVDGSIIAQLGLPDMCMPIQYALTYPDRIKGISKQLRLEDIGRLSFEKPDTKTFRALELAYHVGKTGSTAAAVFNAANEAAVELFLAGRIRFTEILDLIEMCLDKHDAKNNVSLDDLLEADKWARNRVVQQVQQRPKSIKT